MTVLWVKSQSNGTLGESSEEQKFAQVNETPRFKSKTCFSWQQKYRQRFGAAAFHASTWERICGHVE